MEFEHLKEYRCNNCNKLLCKGNLMSHKSALEVKCKGCGNTSKFYGIDANIITRRSELIKAGLIKDTDDI